MYDLIGVNGNAYSVMGYVARAMRECDKTTAEISAYRKDAMSSDYDHLLAVSVAMIDGLNALSGCGDGRDKP
jgi:hypothetical protein